MQSPHWQELLQTRFWQELPQEVSSVPSAHTPSPVQEPQVQLAVQVWVPQLPQSWVALGWQPWPVQLPQVQSPRHTWLPQSPQARVSLGVQTPWFWQEPQVQLA